MEYKIKIQNLEYIPTYNTYEKVVSKVYWNYEATKGTISTGITFIRWPPSGATKPFELSRNYILIYYLNNKLKIYNYGKTNKKRN